MTAALATRHTSNTLDECVAALRQAIVRLLEKGWITLKWVRPSDQHTSYQNIDRLNAKAALLDPLAWHPGIESRAHSCILLARVPEGEKPSVDSDFRAILVAGAIVISSVAGNTLTAIVFGLLIEWGGKSYPWIPLACYGNVVFFGWITFAFATIDRDGIYDMIAGSMGYMSGVFITNLLVMYPVAFGLLCRHLEIRHSEWFTGKVGEGSAQWVGFGYASLINGLTFNFPEAYDLHFSEIKPSHMWAKSLCFFYHLIVTFVNISAVIKIAQLHRDFRAFARDVLS